MEGLLQGRGLLVGHLARRELEHFPDGAKAMMALVPDWLGSDLSSVQR